MPPALPLGLMLLAAFMAGLWRLRAEFLPDDQADDWYAWITNQGAHGGLVGATLMLASLLVAPPAVAWWVAVLCYALAKELPDVMQDRNWRDALSDTANVGAGAGVLAGPFVYVGNFWGAWVTSAIAMTAWALALAHGVARRRANERGRG